MVRLQVRDCPEAHEVENGEVVEETPPANGGCELRVEGVWVGGCLSVWVWVCGCVGVCGCGLVG